jgi:hypothetical protein
VSPEELALRLGWALSVIGRVPPVDDLALARVRLVLAGLKPWGWEIKIA